MTEFFRESVVNTADVNPRTHDMKVGGHGINAAFAESISSALGISRLKVEQEFTRLNGALLFESMRRKEGFTTREMPRVAGIADKLGIKVAYAKSRLDSCEMKRVCDAQCATVFLCVWKK